MRKNRTFLLVVSLFFISTLTLFSSFNLNFFQMLNNCDNCGPITPINIHDYDLQSNDYQESKQWIKNPSFNSPISQYWNNSKTGDLTDIELNEGPGCVNYTVIGDKFTVNYTYSPPKQTEWVMMHNPDFPLYPTDTNPDGFVGFDSSGALANHTWDESIPTPNDMVGQDPSVLWKKNVSNDKNTNGYAISSASISALFNVSANSNIDRENDLDNRDGNTWDHVRFFIRISDLNETRVYEIAYYQYKNDTILNDTYMISVPESNLIFYLTSIFEIEKNFTITMGINFFCEDNGPGARDTDVWHYARIKSLNLTFTYQKIIDQNTHAYWSQTSDILNSTSGQNFIINEAKLNFQYKTDSKWPTSSLNSEFKMIINNNTHSETIKLINASTSFQDAKHEGFNVAPLLVNNVNITLALEVYLADIFLLAENLSISIDNVTLDITLTILTEEEPPPPLIFPPGPDYTPIIYLLITVIAGLVIGFGAYLGYFRYPPMIRKIRKLKKKIKKRKAKTPISVSKRGSIIGMNLKEQLETLNLDLYLKQKAAEELSKTKQQKGKTNLKELFLSFLLCFILIFMLFSLLSSNLSSLSKMFLNNGIFDPSHNSNYDLQSLDYTETKQWIKNPTFDSPIIQWTSSKRGDITDIDLTEDVGYVNYVVINDNRSEIIINSPPLDDNWTMMLDPDHPTYPEDTTIEPTEVAYSWIDDDGAFSNHSWWESAGDQLGQDPGVLWKRNITLPVDMGDYNITSASLSTIINASPDTNVERSDEGIGEQGRGDYVRFFIRISDPSGNYTYEVANYLNEGDNILSDAPMNNVTESDLMFFLSSIFQNDGYKFTITMGLNFWCEDNEDTDEDDWEYTRIKSLNLTFSGQKKINQNTRGTWSQTTEVLNGRDLIVNEAILYFQYKVESQWPENDSPNSEIKILINNNTHSETIKLSTASTTFQDAKPEGFDVTNLIVQKQNILLSLEVYLADNFILAQNQTISIDNVTLYISITVKEKPPPLISPPGQDWALIVYLLIGAIGGIVVAIGLYQAYFKYPPMIRKIRKLKKKIKKRKAKKPVSITNRDYIIQNQLENQLKILNIEQISKGRELKK